MILEVEAVVADGTKPAGTIEPKRPTRQDILLPRGEPLTLKLTVYGANHAVRDISADTIKVGVRQFQDDAAAKLTRQATLTTPLQGKAEITIPASATEPLYEHALYWYDIQLTDGSALRWQVVPVSLLRIAPIVNRSSDANT